MRRIEGHLEEVGPGSVFRGGTRYSYIRIRKNNGKIENLTDIHAYKNVQSELYDLSKFGNSRVTLYTKGKHGYFIYALEHNGVFHSDYMRIFFAWIFILTLTLLVLSIPIAIAIAAGPIGMIMMGMAMIMFWGFGGFHRYRLVFWMWPNLWGGKLLRHRLRARDSAKAA